MVICDMSSAVGEYLSQGQAYLIPIHLTLISSRPNSGRISLPEDVQAASMTAVHRRASLEAVRTSKLRARWLECAGG